LLLALCFSDGQSDSIVQEIESMVRTFIEKVFFCSLLKWCMLIFIRHHCEPSLFSWIKQCFIWLCQIYNLQVLYNAYWSNMLCSQLYSSNVELELSCHELYNVALT